LQPCNRPGHDRRRNGANDLAKKLQSLAGPLQLFAEEIDTSTGAHLGNIPQAFTHLALIDALGRLIDAETLGAPLE
jgi:GH15 family glucan-1,4-alpha-glucosidase